jgi:DNA-binding NtrC family response regulator
MIGRLATNDVPALILGERGTGRHLVARTIHENSGRQAGPFVTIDCESTPESIIDATLFAGTGGSVFVGAIEHMPVLLQSRLARALTDERSRGTGGASRPRVFAASEHDLTESLRAGSLRRDLYDVLSVITLRLPPLRERQDDIPLLVRYFILRFNDELSRTIRGADAQVLLRLQERLWPGNVGELERVVKRACIVARGDVITIDEIAGSLTESPLDRQEIESALTHATRTALRERLVEQSPLRSSTPFHDIIDLVESTLVQEALTITKGNQLKAAEILGVNRATLRKKMPES